MVMPQLSELNSLLDEPKHMKQIMLNGKDCVITANETPNQRPQISDKFSHQTNVSREVGQK